MNPTLTNPNPNPNPNPNQVRLGVAVVPGESCAAAPPPAGRRHLRLSYVIDECEYEAGLAKVYDSTG